MKSIIDQIVAEAKREDEELHRQKRNNSLSKKGRIEAIENVLISPQSCLHVVDIRDIPVSFKSFTSFDPHVSVTQGFYQIVYIPTTSRRHIAGKPFVICQDMLHLRVTVSGPKHWHCLAKRIPELGWIERNSTLTNSLFGIAKKHPGAYFIFTVDWVRYADMITRKANEQGIDIDNKPFVSYQCSQKDFDETYSKKKLCDKKGYLDYITEINEAENDPEMINELEGEI